jgi:hypothetical protein
MLQENNESGRNFIETEPVHKDGEFMFFSKTAKLKFLIILTIASSNLFIISPSQAESTRDYACRTSNIQCQLYDSKQQPTRRQNYPQNSPSSNNGNQYLKWRWVIIGGILTLKLVLR